MGLGFLRRLRTSQRWGALLSLFGIGLTVLLAFLGNKQTPPAASTQALIALLAILAQLGAAWVFSGDGKADPTLAQRSVSRLFGLAVRANTAKKDAELLNSGKPTLTEFHQGVGQLSVHLSYLEEGYLNQIDDWRVFHPRAVEQAEGNKTDDDE